MSTTTEPKGAAGADLPDGLHAAAGVEYLARLEGFSGEHLPRAVILSRGFSETTGFFQDSKGRGYWMTTLNECSCPDYKYRKAGTGKLCKHQKRLAEVLKAVAPASPGLPSGVVGLSAEDLDARRARIAERNARQAEERATRAATVSPSRRGFNLPVEART
jgi:hypothetical protein